VEFEVVYRKDTNNKKIIVGETVRDQIIKTGKLGKYQVKSGVVQGKTFILFIQPRTQVLNRRSYLA
jgi:hypothetical protein